MKKVKSGLGTVVAGTLVTLTERQAFGTSNLKILVGYMEATLPSILPALSEGGRAESVIRLRSFLEDPEMQHLRPELDALVEAVDGVAGEN